MEDNHGMTFVAMCACVRACVRACAAYTVDLQIWSLTHSLSCNQDAGRNCELQLDTPAASAQPDAAADIDPDDELAMWDGEAP